MFSNRMIPTFVGLFLLNPALLIGQDTKQFTKDAFEELQWREVGPFRGGRSAAVAGIADQPQVYYFGSTGGGVWKTTNGGTTWNNLSDGFFGGSIGAIAVSEWDPNVIYVGGGEKTIRGNVSHGDGLYKSVDAGKSWKAMGLADSRHISRIRIHPKNPDLVYAAVMGHLFGPNEQRGVFRSQDGGETWDRILFESPEVGAVDLIMDPTNPRILYASLWQVKRTPYSLESGGPGSALYKSIDAGDTWQVLSENEGFPKAPLGIIGITASPSNPNNLYAIVEAKEGGVYRSRDGGEKWQRTNESRELRQRAWYYSRIYADPADEESVYVLNVRFHHSKDGGKTFSTISVPHGDNHDLWIAPNDPRRMIQSNDGGANVSYDGGKTWTQQDTQPTAQMYRVSVDNSFPYRLLGGQQDNSAVRIRSRSFAGSSISTRDWESTAGGESGHIVAKPDDPDIVLGGSYGGYLTMVNHRTGARRAINVWPDNPMGWGAGDLKYRFQWNFPILFSRHDPDVFYAAANHLFRSSNLGDDFSLISPDLTRNDPSTLGASGGPITKDNTGVEYYATIFAVAESWHTPEVLWAGSDDGLIHVTQDGGNTWSNVTPPDLPEWTQINCIDANPHQPGGAYVAGTRYKLDDFRPYLFRTDDFGATWTKITAGIAEDHFCRAIRVDPEQPELLYAGTERGVYVSHDNGAQWTTLQLNLPIVPITDLAVHNRDLVAATQGRGFWILDDLSPVQALDPKLETTAHHLFPMRSTYRLRGGRNDNPTGRGTNPPDGAILSYWIGQELEESITIRLEIRDGDGTLLRTLVEKPDAADDSSEDEKDKEESSNKNLELLPTTPGFHRVAWDLFLAGAEKFPEMILWNSWNQGPRIVPGDYSATLIIGDWQEARPFVVLADPRLDLGADEYLEQFEYLLDVRDKLTETHQAIANIHRVRKQLSSVEKQLPDADGDLAMTLKDFQSTMKEVEETLYQTQNESAQDPLNFPIRLNDKLSGLARLTQMGSDAPTAQAQAVKSELFEQIDAQLQTLTRLFEEDLPKINEAIHAQQIPLLQPKSTAPEGQQIP